MTTIDEYDFGRIVINGRAFSSDVIIFPDRVEDNWRRKEGHLLHIADIEIPLGISEPDILIVGTGKYGALKVTAETEKYCADRGICIIAEQSDSACKTFNRLCLTRKILGAFHLTC